MARNLFGGTAADVAENIDGSRAPGAEGTVWNGPTEEATQITDLLDSSGIPMQVLTADSQGMVGPFYGPDNITLVYADFGAGRVAMVPINTAGVLAFHLTADDPHGSKRAAVAEITTQRGVANGFATLGPDGKVLPAQLPDALGEGGSSNDWHNVKAASYGALGDGIADDTPAIQAAIEAADYGGVVYFPKGVYKVSQPLDLPRGVTLLGSHSNLMVGPGMVGDEWPCYLQAAPTFNTGAMITIIGEDDGDHPAINGEQRIINLMLDGSKVPTGGLDGIYAKGNVQNVVLRDVCIRQMPNNGIITAGAANGDWPYSWRLHSVMVDNCHVNGMVFERNTDITLEDCQVIGCWSTGFKLINCANGIVTHCRAEWNGNYGFHIAGGWGNWPGSGSMSLIGCSTDRNGWDGVRHDASGNGGFLIQGLMTRRDGRNGGPGGGGYAGLRLSGTAPVVVTGLTCYVGTDDGGTANTSPDYGVHISGAKDVSINSAYLHALLEGIHNDGTNERIRLGTEITTTVGNNFSEDRTPIV
ncbi:right-handed parallel beta-helix repeat-containing protein [Streptomyces lancefieldiae]|uniref:Glycosyl hydrolase family 28-related protein n=1 Tax=Streptomyces lancefieldiae TaxID=3075520 RepID=A0ABU3ASG6_9ACTN|nr:glycosyl hydrolase family 28-related protein [Streptomyces sp. DSM 40712]MDT0611983.1 glycosyl hydrolase family 28-related protein [Streptomyces sp. DSM 40712]